MCPCPYLKIRQVIKNRALEYVERGSRVAADSQLGLFLELERIPSTVVKAYERALWTETALFFSLPLILLLPMKVGCHRDYNGLKKANSYWCSVSVET